MRLGIDVGWWNHPVKLGTRRATRHGRHGGWVGEVVNASREMDIGCWMEFCEFFGIVGKGLLRVKSIENIFGDTCFGIGTTFSEGYFWRLNHFWRQALKVWSIRFCSCCCLYVPCWRLPNLIFSEWFFGGNDWNQNGLDWSLDADAVSLSLSAWIRYHLPCWAANCTGWSENGFLQGQVPASLFRMDLPSWVCAWHWSNREYQQDSLRCPLFTFLWFNPLAAWKYLLGEKVDDEKFALHGLVHVSGISSVHQILKSSNSLRRLTFLDHFNRSVAEVDFPHELLELHFEDGFNQNLNDVVWPKGLHNLSFGVKFNTRLDHMTLPQNLRTDLGLQVQPKLRWCGFAQRLARVVLGRQL